jgi:hypothetical protein
MIILKNQEVTHISDDLNNLVRKAYDDQGIYEDISKRLVTEFSAPICASRGFIPQFLRSYFNTEKLNQKQDTIRTGIQRELVNMGVISRPTPQKIQATAPPATMSQTPEVPQVPAQPTANKKFEDMDTDELRDIMDKSLTALTALMGLDYVMQVNQEILDRLEEQTTAQAPEEAQVA